MLFSNIHDSSAVRSSVHYNSLKYRRGKLWTIHVSSSLHRGNFSNWWVCVIILDSLEQF
jgi:hypothetical protein